MERPYWIPSNFGMIRVNARSKKEAEIKVRKFEKEVFDAQAECLLKPKICKK